MAQDSTLRLQKTKLFEALKKKENDDSQLSDKVIKIVKHVAPLLERIPENMPEYTLHNSNHSAKIVEIMGRIVPELVLDKLNTIEVSLLILSAYLHDIGMTCSHQEREHIIADDEDFKILFKSNVDKFSKYEQYKVENNHRAATFIEDQIFTEYLRRNHVKRSAIYILENLNKDDLILSFDDIPFYKLLVKICDGHGEPVKNLYDTRMWPKETLVGENIVNVQYLSLVLRLADILDLDAERTPRVIYEFVNPENPISILEWKKHRSIIGTKITDSKILFEAECSSPEVERALREFIDWIELERRESMELLKTYKPEEQEAYFLSLTESVTSERIQSDGTYIYNDLSFSIDYHRIMDLLMGQRLYKDPMTAIRELLQNSFDAVKVRQKMFEGTLESIEPYIKINLEKDTLTIEDNGIGMDEKIFKDYFLQVGKSYYSSSTFYRKFSDVDVTSEFGIGVLSVFMIARSLKVESRMQPEDPLFPCQPICFEIPTAHSFLIQRESKKNDIGTKLTLSLKDNHALRDITLLNVLEEIIPEPIFPIYIVQDGELQLYTRKEKVSISNFEFPKIDDLKSELSEKGFSHQLFCIDFPGEESGVDDINGELHIVNFTDHYMYRRQLGCLCQRNFSIGTPILDERFRVEITDNIRFLFPEWLGIYLNINLVRKACLSITPDRTELIIDEKFKILKSKIEKKVIKFLAEKFDNFKNEHGPEEFNRYISMLRNTGFLCSRLKFYYDISDNASVFLLNYLSGLCLNSNGKLERKYGIEIKNSTLCFVDNRFNIENFDELLKLKNEFNADILIGEKGGFLDYSYDLVLRLLMGKLNYQDNLKPIKIIHRPKFRVPIIIFDRNEISSSVEKSTDISVFNSKGNCEDTPILFTVLSEQHTIIINNNHGVIVPIASDELCIKEFESQIKLFVRNLIDQLQQSTDVNEIKLAYSGDTNAILKGILTKDEKVLVKLNQIVDEVWKGARSRKTINETHVRHEITCLDLPWHWSE